VASSKNVSFIEPAVRMMNYRSRKEGAAEGNPTGAFSRLMGVSPILQPGLYADFSDRSARVRSLLKKYLSNSALPKGVINPQDFIPNVGAATSQGDIAHRARDGRNFFGITGAGVKIGVLSDSVRFLEQVQTSGDLPPDVTVLPGESGTTGIPGAPFSGEGTAMLEITHDLAPGAKLFFATA